RRRERRDRPSAGSSPESESARGIRADPVARVRGRIEGNRRRASHCRRTGCRCGEGRRRTDPARRVINELTSLPRHYTPAEMKAAAERDRRVRVGGNINLLAALRDAGVRRYLLQSSGFWYAPSPGLADESVPLTSSASSGVEAGARTYRELMGDQVGFASCRE